MKTRRWAGTVRLVRLLVLFAALLSLRATRVEAADADQVFQIWPAGKMPGQTRIRGEEAVVTDRRRPFTQVTNVSTPTLTVFLPPPEKRTGAAILALPGGGLQRLAYEHEGLEIADWLCPQGIAVFVLKYRVPAQAEIGLMDAQRAMSLIRQNAENYQIDPNRLGIIGFSAGGELGILLAMRHPERAYAAIDAADEFSCRPANAALIYPGGLTRRGALREDIAAGLNREAVPPLFLVHAFPDASDNTLALASALKQKNIPCEVHLYQEGGHGFGARESGLPLNSWKERYIAWLAADGFFDKPYVSRYVDQLIAAADARGTLPQITKFDPQATLSDAYAAQGQYVRRKLATERLAGFKVSSVALADGAKRPVMAALFQSGRVDAARPVVVELAGGEAVAVEVKLGYIVSNGLDVSYRLTNIEQVKGAVEAVVAVVEVPADFRARMDSESRPFDSVAANLGAGRYLVGGKRISPDDINPNQIKLGLTRSPTSGVQPPLIGEAGMVDGGQWENLRLAINEIIDQGYALHAGDIILTDTLLTTPAPAGSYAASFDGLGVIAIEIR